MVWGGWKPRLGLPALFVMLISGLVLADTYRALTTVAGVGKFAPARDFDVDPVYVADALTGATPVRVAIARSDDAALPDPVPLSTRLSFAQIESLTRHALALVGGFHELIQRGDMVLVKPNIVSNQLSRLTTLNVVKAVVRLIHEAAGGDVEIVIGEGSAFPTGEEMQYTWMFDESPWRGQDPGEPVWEQLWDEAGYQDLLSDPDLAGINIRLSNLNGPREDLVHVDIPGGGFADYNGGRVFVHPDVLEADVHITVPSMKLHGFTGTTVAMKNHIGLYPGTRYGFPKKWGVPQDDYATRLLHVADLPRFWVDEEIVDMVLVGGVDYAIVDAVVANGNKRRNTILAGYDVVAVDHVATRLMGMNPDDIDYLVLGEMAGLGTNQSERIKVVGSTIEASASPFPKSSYPPMDFGRSNRTWTLRGPFPAAGIDDPMAHPFIADERTLRPVPGLDGWSEPMYFFDDRIDLKSYYGVDSRERTVAYAFTCFEAPQDQVAELWVGSDEELDVYLNGQLAYRYAGRLRIFDADELVKDRHEIGIRQGENTLMVKVYQYLSNFDFTLNICEPNADPAYDGNRVFGLEFHMPAETTTTIAEPDAATVPEEPSLEPNYPNPFNARTVIPYRVPPASGGLPVDLAVFDMAGQRVRTLVNRSMYPGHHLTSWDGRDADGGPVASGAYLCALRSGAQVHTRKLLLVR